MSYRKSESETSPGESLLNKSERAEFARNLLTETNKTFQNWLNDLDASPPRPAVASSRAAETYRAPVRREISFQGTLTVDGYLGGAVCSPDGTLVIGERGEIDGDVSVNVAVIYGSVRGDIRATTKVELGSTGRLIGDVETLELAIQPGAVFEGRCAFPSPDDEPAELALRAAH